MIQIVSRNGKVFCTTSVPYPKDVVDNMKKAGYKVTEKKETEKKE